MSKTKTIKARMIVTSSENPHYPKIYNLSGKTEKDLVYEAYDCETVIDYLDGEDEFMYNLIEMLAEGLIDKQGFMDEMRFDNMHDFLEYFNENFCCDAYFKIEYLD